MRPPAAFSFISFVAAAVFINQIFATPMQSDCTRTISRKAKSAQKILTNEKPCGRLEHLLGDSERNQEQDDEYSFSDWISYFKSFWNYLHEEACHHPLPSPSESPIPEGIGESPQAVDSKESEKGINQAAYDQFFLNELFYDEIEEEALAEVYDEHKSTLHMMMKRAERGSLTKVESKKWSKVTKAIIQSYKKERGAIFFDIAFSHLWKYCGWVEMNNTFVTTDKYMRICVSLISVGMKDITRLPEEGKDFIVPDESDPDEVEHLSEPILFNSGRQSLDNLTRSEAEVIDLFGYPEFCDSPLDVDPNCYGFCCLTPYYGSEFCHDCGF